MPSADPRQGVGATGQGWTTEAPAKVNLDLRMLGVRADGYHLLSTTLQTVALADRLTLRAEPGPFAITCDVPGVPADARNLAWQGATAMAEALGVALEGWRLHVEKRVPAEAGLGGGSSDAAAAARLVACAAGVECSSARLADVIRPLGADVAFFAWGGTVRGLGVGDVLTPLPDVPDAAVILVRPGFGVSTREAYGWYDADLGARLFPGTEGPNDLEAPVSARHPEVAAIVGRLRDAGAELAAMSGSGSACFGLFRPGADLSGVLTGWPPGTRVWQTHLLSRSAYAERTRCRPAAGA